MRPPRASDLLAGWTQPRLLPGDRRQVRSDHARFSIVLGFVILTLALGAASAKAQLFLPLSSFGSAGSAAGQFQSPLGVAVDQSTGDVYVADNGNARLQKFDGTGAFIAAWGWGVTDGMPQSEVCTSGCQAGIAGSGAGQFSSPTSVAVDSSGGASNGDVYVGDTGNNVVLKFDSNGNFLATIDGTASPQGHFAMVAGVAVDQSGNLWVADGSSDFISEYDPAGNFVQQWQDPFGQTVAIAVDGTNGFVYLIRGTQATERFTLTGADETVIDSGAGVALGVDPATGNLFVDHAADVAVYDAGANLINTVTLTSSDSQGLAFGTTAGELYVSDRTANNVTIYGPPTTPGPPLIFSESSSNVSDTGATLNASIVPFGLDTTCFFQYVDDTDFLSTGYATAISVPCVPADLGSSFTFELASATISGLTTNTVYHFHAVATNADGMVTGTDQTFQTTGLPVVVNQSSSNITATEAALNATINPTGLDTTCEFQYVDDADFQATGYTTATSTPCSPSDLGSSHSPQGTSGSATGLTPATTYHFRVVAMNADGTVNGDDQTFLTLIAGPPSVISESSASITDTSATLNASINPFGLDTTCVFQYVDDAAFQATGYGTATTVPCSPSDLGDSFAPQSATGSATGLTPGTTYHFHAVAMNADGTATGTDQTFQTLQAFMLQVGTFGSPGFLAGQFQGPVGVAVDQRGGKVYVADSANARIQRFNVKGVFKAAWGWGVTDGQAASEVCKNKNGCQAGLTGVGAGQFQFPTSVAVDSSKSKSKGSVYVGDVGNNVVQKFKSSGKFLSTIDGQSTPQGHFQSLVGIAVDQSGNLWTADASTGNVDEFDSNGMFLQQWAASGGSLQAIAVDGTNSAVYLILSGTTMRFSLAGTNGTTVDSSAGVALGLDPSTGNLYVDHGANVAVYDNTGVRIGTLPSLGGGTTTNSQGLAFRAKGSSGRNARLYVGDASNDSVAIYGPREAGAPFISAESATNVGATGETLQAGIVPLGKTTTCTFQYVTQAGFAASGYSTATSVPCAQADLGSSFIPQLGSATVSGLTVGAFYHYRVIATNSAGTVTGADQTFQAGPGLWTPAYRCPVDDPATLATDGVNVLPALPGLELDERQHHDRHHDDDHRKLQPAGGPRRTRPPASSPPSRHPRARSSAIPSRSSPARSSPPRRSRTRGRRRTSTSSRESSWACRSSPCRSRSTWRAPPWARTASSARIRTRSFSTRRTPTCRACPSTPGDLRPGRHARPQRNDSGQSSSPARPRVTTRSRCRRRRGAVRTGTARSTA